MKQSVKDQEKEDWRVLLAQPESRRILERIVRKTGFLEIPQSNDDALTAAYMNGSRYIGWWIKHEMDKVAPEAFAELITRKESFAG